MHFGNKFPLEREGVKANGKHFAMKLYEGPVGGNGSSYGTSKKKNDE